MATLTSYSPKRGNDRFEATSRMNTGHQQGPSISLTLNNEETGRDFSLVMDKADLSRLLRMIGHLQPTWLLGCNVAPLVEAAEYEMKLPYADRLKQEQSK